MSLSVFSIPSVAVGASYFYQQNPVPPSGYAAGRQLWNPLYSGVNLLISSLSLIRDTAGGFWYFYATKIISAFESPAAIKSDFVFNRFIDAPAAKGEIYELNTTPPIDGHVAIMDSPIEAIAGVRIDTVKGSGFVVPPGRGFTVITADPAVVDIPYNITLQWEEKPI